MNKGFTPVLLLILGLLVGGAVVYFASNFHITKKTYNTIQNYSDISSEPDNTNKNSNNISWKEYKNNYPEFTIKYPSDWKIDNSKAEIEEDSEVYSSQLTVYKSQYKVVFQFPSAFGPTNCIYDDQPRIEDGGYANYCTGEFIEFSDSNSNHRRLVNPDRNVNSIGWNVYTKYANSDYFVTVPPIYYEVPANYDESVVSIMDEIVKVSVPTSSK